MIVWRSGRTTDLQSLRRPVVDKGNIGVGAPVQLDFLLILLFLLFLLILFFMEDGRGQPFFYCAFRLYTCTRGSLNSTPRCAWNIHTTPDLLHVSSDSGDLSNSNKYSRTLKFDWPLHRDRMMVELTQYNMISKRLS